MRPTRADLMARRAARINAVSRTPRSSNDARKSSPACGSAKASVRAMSAGRVAESTENLSVGRPVAAVVSSVEERSFLERQVRRCRVARGMSDRRRIVLRCADGLTSKAVVAELGAHKHTVGKWQRRFLQDRVKGLSDAPRSGRPRSMEGARAGEVVKRVIETSPPEATRWSIRSMAREAELSRTTLRRIRKAFGLQPHRSETFKLSSDPLFSNPVFSPV